VATIVTVDTVNFSREAKSTNIKTVTVAAVSEAATAIMITATNAVKRAAARTTMACVLSSLFC
jgi:hypothetical protein